MPINLVIQEKRKELGLTQEQVADYLNVSIPAVSKWEKGSTSPDVSLLAPLARLLRTDLNTLLGFQEDISEQEIGYFCGEAAQIARKEGIAAGFEAAEQKIHEYPHNETLLQCLTIQLDGLLSMSGLPDEEARRYDAVLDKWYRRLAESRDNRISNSANYMMANRFIRGGDYDRAQEILDSMPDKEDAVSGMADKGMLQINLYLRRGETEKAVKDLQSALLTALGRVQILLYKMVDAELADGRMQTAKEIADKAGRMAELFDLWEYNAFAASLQIASIEKNADACICLLRKMLAAMHKSWDMGSSPLFYRIARPLDSEQVLPVILSAMETDPEYDFLRDRSDFRELLSEYKGMSEMERGLTV